MQASAHAAVLQGLLHPLGVDAPAGYATRIDERRGFVALKLAFMQASDDVPGALGVLLQRRVRAARQGEELLSLRRVLLGALPVRCERSALHHMALHQPDTVF